MGLKCTDSDSLLDFVNEFYQFCKDLQDKYVGYCNSVLSCITNADISKIEGIKKLYGMLEKNTFNIFEPLENYEKEKFNEIILTQILDPKTKEIGNIEFLNIFCNLLSEISKKTVYHFGNDVVVENQIGNKEYGFIDILISDKKNAIIVESKINDASDQPDQLAGYYRYVKEELKKNVLCVVYIRPIYDESKMPPLDTYDVKYASETAEVKKKLVCLSVIGSNQNKDLCHGFLDVCSNIAKKEEKEKAKIYIQQYSELLKLKGGSKMLTNVKKEMLEKLYSDAESVKKMQVVVEIWENRWEILASMIKDSLYQKGFSHNGDDEHCTEKNIKEKIYVVFTDYDYKKHDYGFGFWYREDTSKSIQKSLENLLKNYKNKLLSDDVENDNDCFICKRFIFEIDQPINDIVDTIHKMYEELEKMAVDVLK